MSEDKKLYEVEHDYYCEEQNYHTSKDTVARYSSWKEFASSECDNDPDLNLVFRWDWDSLHEDKSNISPDDYYRDCELKVFWMTQRKGAYRCSIVQVCRADEPVVREWLETRWQHLQKLWSPISGASND